MIDLQGKSVLITGGTRGLGKAIGFEFARAGAVVFLTYRWGSVSINDLVDEFQAAGLAAPYVVECDASDTEATAELMTLIKEKTGRLDCIVSNVAFSKVIHELSDLKRSTLELSLGYSAWPLIELIQAAQIAFGRFPKYVIGISSDGGEVCHDGYDAAGISKAVLETLCRYLALRLKAQGVRVNAVRPGFFDTASSRATFGDDVIEAAQKQARGIFLEPSSVGQVCLALCSGLMDAVTGQVIVVDEGWSLVSPLAYLTGRGLPGEFPLSTEDGSAC